ncbi:MAG TPA: MBL fold metallo-hydrolase [Candidatus Latescibacteria bacterium]|jgi:L-ascorbate metabolism protein UlaG (beta-lactamase superfamily)|nr:MBL fold metallo-hydrolase [Candidatus Latescibacterota bacterium]HJP34025.1 MBL fold metallo-hydrolase [Candidatus Latescibacterota bacterium]
MHPFEDLDVPAGHVGIHWFGQSSLGLKHPDGTILQVDPYYPRQRPADRFIYARAPLMEEALRTDWVLLTHDHGDHTCMESIDRMRGAYPDLRFVGPPESCNRLREGGIAADLVNEVTAGDSRTMGSFTANTVLAKPHDGDTDADIKPPDVQHLGYVIDSGDVRLYVSGDPINNFADHEELLSPIRDLEPHIGFLTNHPDEGEFPFFEGSGRIAGALGLKTAVPTHYSCFVTRDYDPQAWANHLPDDVDRLVIPYNQSVVYNP